MYHLRVNFCIHLFWTLPPSLSHFSLIPTSQTQYHPNTRCSEAAQQDTEVHLGCFRSPKPISKQTHHGQLMAQSSLFLLTPHSGRGAVRDGFCRLQPQRDPGRWDLHQNSLLNPRAPSVCSLYLRHFSHILLSSPTQYA